MAKEIWVIIDDSTGLYLTAFSYDNDFCQWGNSDNAIQFGSEEDAQVVCDYISKGGVHPVLAPSH